jgi:two-component system LytT family sensor kinase
VAVKAGRWGVVAGVVLFWIVFGMLWGAQSALGATMQGRPPASIVAVMRATVVQMLPWIPVTLAAIVMARRVRLTARHPARIGLHLMAAMVLAFVANVLVVLTFWLQAGRFNGFPTLMREGAKWGVINFHVALLVYAAVVGVTSYVQETRERRARELQLSRVEGQLTRARLEALNAQIRPHFLFNTLHAIGQMWRSGRSNEADAMLDRLGSLFHRVLSSTSRLEIPLEEELQLVSEYFAIEEARFRERLTTRIEVPADARQCMVPPLILQPLVENAVRHGVSQSPSGGTVTVSARLTDGRLTLTVRDDGAGSSNGSSEKGTGTGLRNTRERIAQMYGDRGRMTMDHPAEGGTVVLVELPAHG